MSDPRSPGDPAAPLHASDRRLDRAFAALTQTEPGAFLHCLQQRAGSTGLPAMLRERLPTARWIPSDTHALTYIDPSDHLAVHQAWLQACHGPDRTSHARVRTIAPLVSDDGGEPGPVGSYSVELIDLIGVEGIDTVVVTLTSISAADQRHEVPPPSPRGAASFRLRLDPVGVVLSGNERVDGLLGRPLPDLLGTSLRPLMHDDDLEESRRVWQDVLAKPDQSQTARLRLQHGDGTWRWFSSTSWLALDQPDTVISEFHDIGALVDAEEALHASELSFRTLAESLPVGVAVLDPAGLVQFANHRLVTLLLSTGLAGPDSDTPTPLPGGSTFAARWTDLVAPSVADQVADLVRPTNPGEGGPRSRQVSVELADGRVVHLLVQAVTNWSHEGQRVIVSVQDVSAEVQLDNAHARLVNVVDEVDDVVILCRLDGTIIYVNQAGFQFLQADAVGQPLQEFMRPATRAFTEDAVLPELRAMKTWTGDMEAIGLDGALHVMAATISPVVGNGPDDLHVGITMRNVTADRAHERELARLARHDTLTGLPNRFALMELLEDAVQRTASDASLAVFFIDLDNLKIVNDGLGHSAGDRLLVAVAAELQRAANPATDLVARFGGDEFVVVAEGLGADEALGRAQEFLTAIERAEVPGVASQVAASIGVATATGADAGAEALIRDADAAMYAAKRSGRAQCARFDDVLRKQVSRRFKLEASLRHALATDELTVHFQPVVSMADGAVTGVEALCRWGESSPSEFIPIAEESGLIRALGAQVFTKALTDAHRLRTGAAHLADLRVGINVSARELDQPDFAARTLDTIAAGPIPIDQVVIELTESVLIDPRDEIDATLRTLRDAGVVLALDDFGSGYSSLAYLRRYPLDVLKLDISYIQAMEHDHETRIIAEGVVSMATRLGVRVVAEGIETAEQLQLVKDLGVSWAQGFFLGRPAPVDELLANGLAPVAALSPRG